MCLQSGVALRRASPSNALSRGPAPRLIVRRRHRRAPPSSAALRETARVVAVVESGWSGRRCRRRSTCSCRRAFGLRIDDQVDRRPPASVRLVPGEDTPRMSSVRAPLVERRAGRGRAPSIGPPATRSGLRFTWIDDSRPSSTIVEVAAGDPQPVAADADDALDVVLVASDRVAEHDDVPALGLEDLVAQLVDEDPVVDTPASGEPISVGCIDGGRDLVGLEREGFSRTAARIAMPNASRLSRHAGLRRIRAWCPRIGDAGLRDPSSVTGVLVGLQHDQEGLLRNLHVTDLAHALLALPSASRAACACG